MKQYDANLILIFIINYLIVQMIILPLSVNGEPLCTPLTTISKPFDQVYHGLPYSPGERSDYDVSYMGILAGRARLEIRVPVLWNGQWHQVYAADARTGDWYRMIFVGHDSIVAYNNPAPQMAAYFSMVQDEGKLLGKRMHKHTEIRFDQKQCTATKILNERGKASKTETTKINAGVMDPLSVVFHLRNIDYSPGKSLRFPVYSSDKGWWLEVEPIEQEQIEVPAGIFSTMKLRLHTYLGDALQQKGDLLIWLSIDHIERPLVQVKAEVRIGSLLLQLTKFKPGLSLE